jgi:hypothetical protein
MTTLSMVRGDSATFNIDVNCNLTGYTLLWTAGALEKTPTVTDAPNGLATVTLDPADSADATSVAFPWSLTLTSPSNVVTTAASGTLYVWPVGSTPTTLLDLIRAVAKDSPGYAQGQPTGGGLTNVLNDTSGDSPLDVLDDKKQYANSWVMIEEGAANVGEVRRISSVNVGAQSATLNAGFSSPITTDMLYGIYTVPPFRHGMSAGIADFINETLKHCYYRDRILVFDNTNGAAAVSTVALPSGIYVVEDADIDGTMVDWFEVQGPNIKVSPDIAVGSMLYVTALVYYPTLSALDEVTAAPEGLIVAGALHRLWHDRKDTDRRVGARGAYSAARKSYLPVPTFRLGMMRQ